MLTTILKNTIAGLFITKESKVIEDGDLINIINPKSDCTIEIDRENGTLKCLRFHYHPTVKKRRIF